MHCDPNDVICYGSWTLRALRHKEVDVWPRMCIVIENQNFSNFYHCRGMAFRSRVMNDHLTGQKWWCWVRGSKCASIVMFKTFVDGLKIMPVALSRRVETANIITVLQVCDFLAALIKPCFATMGWTMFVESFSIILSIKSLGFEYVLHV